MQHSACLWPTSKQACLDQWTSSREIPVPTSTGGVLSMKIERLFECSAVNGLALDLLIDARASKRAPLRQFGVVFSTHLPEGDYPLPTLWLNAGEGRWLESN